jgi:biopolymer transport protein ExbD
MNHEVPLVPYIDFLLCLIAFLLVTAVWTELKRMPADALTPGAGTHASPKRVLHVDVQERQFNLSWRDDNTLISTSNVEKESKSPGQEQLKFSRLAAQIQKEWETNGLHRDASDDTRDRAVLHTRNSAPYAEVVAALDALRETKRDVTTAGRKRHMPAFDVSFAVD